MLSNSEFSANVLRLLRHDISAFRGWIIFLFILISAALLSVGFVWPKVYESSTSIYIDEKNIIRPLMEGTAVPTDIRDRSRIAEEVIFSRKIMDLIVEAGGWTGYEFGTAAYEQLIEDIEARTEIKAQGPNIIIISYHDSDPERTYAVANAFADLFIEESLSTKQRESLHAFEFINNQANNYHAKLLESERKLKEFRSNNLDIRPGSQADVVARISTLRERVDAINLELAEAKNRAYTLSRQLSGEAELTGSLSRETQYRERLIALQAQLEDLRLSYHESYPDIISLKGQIEELNQSILREQRNRKNKSAPNSSDAYHSLSGNALYEDLRSQLAETKTTISTLTIRYEETRGLLEKELERAVRINEMDATLTELRRDYEVNQDIYEDLARRRENARVSMTLDQEQQGYTLRIQEPATLPITPTGFRFMHFAAGGLFLGLAIPALLVFVKFRYDPRVRSESDIVEKLNLPILSTIPHLAVRKERRRRALATVFLSLILATHLSAYATIAVLKYLGEV